MAAETYAAVDLGAESGRVVLGQLTGNQLSLREVHRFNSTPVWVAGHLHWDALRLYDEVLNGLTAAVKSGGELKSLGVDTWGVDFGLLDRTGALLGNPYHYRDHRTDGVVEAVFKVVPAAEVFGATGTRIMEIDTLYQLYAMVQQRSPVLDVADRFLMMPDLFHYWLCGAKKVEYSIASTSQCYDAANNGWATPLMKRLGIPTGIFRRWSSPGRAWASFCRRWRSGSARRVCRWWRRPATTPPRRWRPCRPGRTASPTSARAPGRSWARSRLDRR